MISGLVSERRSPLFTGLRRVLKALPSNVRFRHAIGADRRAIVRDRWQCDCRGSFQEMWVGSRHAFLMVLSVAILANVARSEALAELTF